MYIYIVSNPAHEGWLKVGKTTNIKRRMSSMQTGAPTEYSVDLLIEFFDDRPIHNKLDAMGYERKGEWFKADMADVRRVVLETIAEFDRERSAFMYRKKSGEVVHEHVQSTGLEPISRRKQAG